MSHVIAFFSLQSSMGKPKNGWKILTQWYFLYVLGGAIYA
jgi:hypothetical protein